MIDVTPHLVAVYKDQYTGFCRIRDTKDKGYWDIVGCGEGDVEGSSVEGDTWGWKSNEGGVGGEIGVVKVIEVSTDTLSVKLCKKMCQCI